MLELGQNRTHFANGARSRSFPCEPITRGRMECAPSIPARAGPDRFGAAETRREVWLDMAESITSILIRN